MPCASRSATRVVARCPVSPRPPPAAPGGRGLGIVQTLSSRWGVLRDEGETTVWAVLMATPMHDPIAPPVMPVADPAPEPERSVAEA